MPDSFLNLRFDFIAPGRVPLMCCLIAFILTFFVTRLIVRYIRAHAESTAPRKWWQPRNYPTRPTAVRFHLHHVVIGVVLVMISGVTLVTLAVDGGAPNSPWQQSSSGSARRWCSTSTR